MWIDQRNCNVILDNQILRSWARIIMRHPWNADLVGRAFASKFSHTVGIHTLHCMHVYSSCSSRPLRILLSISGGKCQRQDRRRQSPSPAISIEVVPVSRWASVCFARGCIRSFLYFFTRRSVQTSASYGTER